MRKKNGFSLFEILVASTLLTVAFGGILLFISQYLHSLETTHNLSIALNACQERMEKIKARIDPTDSTEQNTISFDNLTAYNELAFDVYADNSDTALTNFKGVSYVKDITNDTTPALPVKMYEIRVVVCWEDAGGRIIGEDKDLNGELDSGEDTWTTDAHTGEIDSAASVRMNLLNIE